MREEYSMAIKADIFTRLSLSDAAIYRDIIILAVITHIKWISSEAPLHKSNPC